MATADQLYSVDDRLDAPPAVVSVEGAEDLLDHQVTLRLGPIVSARNG
jgi:hypothetical protein